MLDKIKGYFQNASLFRKVKGFFKKSVSPLTFLAITYATIVIILITTMYLVCMYSWYLGKEVFPNLLQLLEKCVSAPFVAALVFLGGCFVDSDDDGIPDSFDKTNDKKDDEHRPPRREGMHD